MKVPETHKDFAFWHRRLQRHTIKRRSPLCRHRHSTTVDDSDTDPENDEVKEEDGVRVGLKPVKIASRHLINFSKQSAA